MPDQIHSQSGRTASQTSPTPTDSTATGAGESSSGGGGWVPDPPDVDPGSVADGIGSAVSGAIDAAVNGFFQFIIAPITSVLNGLAADFFGVGKIPFENPEMWVFSGPANPGKRPLLNLAYEQAWFGPAMFLGIMMLIVGVYVRNVFTIFGVPGFDSGYEQKKTKKNLHTGVLAILAWYPLAMAFLVVMNTLSRTLIQVNKVNQGSFGEALLGFVVGSKAGAIAGGLAGLSAGTLGTIMLVITGLLAILLKLLFAIRPILIAMYLIGMPTLLALYFSNLPILSDMAGNIARKYVPIVMMPLPAALLIFIFQQTFLRAGIPAGAAAGVGKIILIPLFFIIALWGTWKMFGMAAPTTQGAMGSAGTVLAGGAAAGMALRAGASPYMAMQAAKGRPGRLAAYGVMDKMNPDSGLWGNDGSRSGGGAGGGGGGGGGGGP